MELLGVSANSERTLRVIGGEEASGRAARRCRGWTTGRRACRRSQPQAPAGGKREWNHRAAPRVRRLEINGGIEKNVRKGCSPMTASMKTLFATSAARAHRCREFDFLAQRPSFLAAKANGNAPKAGGDAPETNGDAVRESLDRLELQPLPPVQSRELSFETCSSIMTGPSSSSPIAALEAAYETPAASGT